MKKNKRRLAAALCAAVIFAGSVIPSAANAGEPSESYNYDRWNEAVPSQAGYAAERSVSGSDLGVGSFDTPSDIFCAWDGLFYIADTKNDRIVAVDEEFTSAVKVYSSFTKPDGSKTTLDKPKGVYVSQYTGYMYIADSENDRVLIATREGGYISEITRPDDPVYNAPTFKPLRVLADKAGNVYTVLGNITTGAAMFSPDGKFIGFYGANRVQPTKEIIGTFFRSLFLTEEKKARRTRNVPTGITSFDIDGDFIFTCTSSSSQKTDTVKKLNAAGKNIFANLPLVIGDYTPIYDSYQNTVFSPAITDIDISEDGCINCLDYTTGRIFQYDEDCNLLFIAGAKANQLGGFTSAAALESHANKLYVVDSVKDTVTVFRETDFGAAVHKATALYNAGYYEEALEPWYEVLRRDSGYKRANIGVASALLRKGDYKGSMKYAKRAGSPDIYNKAFEGYRREFIKKHFAAIAAVIMISTAALILRGRRRRRRSAAGNNKEKEEQSDDGSD
ncbi:MAG: hypothetical protein IKO47_07690 [Ruminococcus sp.]|nr:hypothetical protein [Ruminococcus sp.]